jgi:hypothetical protein
MSSWRLHARGLDGRELLSAALAGSGTALVILLAGHKLGNVEALLVPLGVAVLAIVLMRPMLALCLTIGVAILIEGGTFGLFTFSSNVYTDIYKRLTPLDAMVVLSAASVALDVLRDGRSLRFPKELRFPSLIVVLGMLSGIMVGKSGGEGLKSLALAENLIAYMVIVPLTVANLKVEPSRLRLALGGLFALAIVKALLGIAEVALHKGISIEGSANLTYYEPTANWVIMLALLGIVVAAVARLRPPLWMLLGSPLLIAAMVLSYRRSFWIATVLGLVLVILLALSPVGRRLLVPAGLVVAASIWLLGSINFQSQSPIVRRAASLSPSSLSKNVEDRYRLDERANVLGDLEKKPVTGLGMLVPWEAGTRPLPVEHEDARQYVHFALLWWWMKLGIFGLLAYPLLLFAMARLAWKVWRRSAEAMFRAFGLASLCGVAGLLAAETTATFTGTDLRFTVVLAAQIGLLALLAGQIPDLDQAEIASTEAPA